MKLADLKNFNLPDESGVYFFMKSRSGVARAERGPIDETSTRKSNFSLDTQDKKSIKKDSDEILYIGKATSLKSRVRSYFDNNILHTRGLHIANMVTLADRVEWQTTRSVLEAVLLENELIKKYLPKYNTIAKDNKSYFVLVITEEDFPRVVLARYKDIDEDNKVLIRSKNLGINPSGLPLKNGGIVQEKVLVKKIFGPYPSGQYAKESLKVIRKIFPFRDKCTPYDPKKPFKKNPCFSYQIGLCPGVCVGFCDKRKYKKIIERLITFLEGDGEKVRQDLEEDMKNYSKELKFEDAQRVKEMLFALDHIRDAHLINKDIKEEDLGRRIEAYDVAHLSGNHRVGAMTVVLGGVLAKHEYKKFKITKNKNDDLEGLRELFTRRIKHLDWGIPDVVVVDGDERHVKVVEEIIQNFISEIRNPEDKDDNNKKQLFKTSAHSGDFSDQNILESLENIKVVAVTKNKSHKASKLIGEKATLENFQQEIIMANAEAHRFSLSYHKLLRKKSFLK